MGFIIRNIIYLFKKFPTSCILNILGLSVAFAVFILVAIQTYYDTTFNAYFEKKDRIEVLSVYFPSSDAEWKTTNVDFVEDKLKKVPEILSYCFIESNQSDISFEYKDKNNVPQTYNTFLIKAYPGFLDVFTPEIVSGDTSRVLNDFNYVMVPESLAKKVFGQEDPIGKTLHFEGWDDGVTVDAVYKDFPANSSIRNGVLRRSGQYTNDWSFIPYIEIREGSRDIALQKLNSEDVLTAGEINYFKESGNSRPLMRMQAFNSIYLDAPGKMNSFITLLAIGILVLIIAYINYLNFAIAMVPSRVKTINIHKILGVSITRLRVGISFEAIFFAILSFGLALLYIYFFNTTMLNGFFDADISLAVNIEKICVIGVFLLFLIYLISIYPAYYTTSFPVAVALQSSFALSPKGVKLRNILITIQFAGAIILIIISSFIKLQHSYMQKYSWGFETENIIHMPYRSLNTDLKTFGEEMKKNPQILGYTSSGNLPGNIWMQWEFGFEGQNLNMKVWTVEPNFLEFFDLKIIAGENFSSEETSKNGQILFNERVLNKYNFDNDIIGKSFDFGMGTPIYIKGIIGNINFETLHHPIEPMAFMVFQGEQNQNRQNYLLLKIKGEDVQGTINYIRDNWSRFSDSDFEFKFLDETMNEYYKREENQSLLIGLFGIITILITIMGIYGLILFNTKYKEKEIAIRKVNGASIGEVIYMLNRQLIVLFGIAFVISIPISHFVISRWLENFAYKLSVPWWLYLLAGLAVFIISAVTVTWQSYKAAITNPVESLNNE